MAIVLLLRRRLRATQKQEHELQHVRLRVGGDAWTRQPPHLGRRPAQVRQRPRPRLQLAGLQAGLGAMTRLLPRVRARVPLPTLHPPKPRLLALRRARLLDGLDATILRLHPQVNLPQHRQNARLQGSSTAATMRARLQRIRILLPPHPPHPPCPLPRQ